MAVTIHAITNVDGDATKSYEFCGLSTDTKPTEMDGKAIEVNSLFLELNTGDKVSHNGQHWISKMDANVYEPGVYGWGLYE